MRLGAAVLALAGCNRVFGLTETQPQPVIDAAYFDAPADAPFACPALGGNLVFSKLLHQIPQRCIQFQRTTSGDLATAYCFEPAIQIASGPLDGPFTPLPGFEQVGTNHLDIPHLAPEGDELFVRNWDMNTVVGHIQVHQRSGASFTFTHEVAGPWDSYVKFGTPSRGPLRRMFVQNPPSQDVTEVEIDPQGGVTPIHTYTAGDFGASFFVDPPSLSPDGLRIILTAGGTASSLLYSDRAATSVTFNGAREVPNIPNATGYHFVTEDCGRLYFSALGYVFWVQQQ